MKRKIGLFVILCCIIGISFWGYSLYRKYTCPVWDSGKKQCYQCDYQKPVFVGKIKVINHCSTRTIMRNCCETGFYSVPNNYISPDGDFTDCDRYFNVTNKGVFDLCGMYNPLSVTFINVRSIVYIITLFFICLFAPFWIIKKIKKKCWGYSIIKGIMCFQIIIASFANHLFRIVDYVTRDAGYKTIPYPSIIYYFEMGYGIVVWFFLCLLLLFPFLAFFKEIRKNVYSIFKRGALILFIFTVIEMLLHELYIIPLEKKYYKLEIPQISDIIEYGVDDEPSLVVSEHSAKYQTKKLFKQNITQD